MFNIARAIQHPFEDRDWASKILIGTGISLVPVLNFAMVGYALGIVRNVERGSDVPLPTWNELGDHFVEGLKMFVVQLIYALPIIGLSLLIGFGSTLLGMAIGSRRGDADSALAAAIAFLWLAFAGVSALYGLLIGFITPALYIQVARTRTISAAFRLQEIWALIRSRLGEYTLLLVLTVVVAFVLGAAFSVVGLVPIIGLCFMVFLIPLAVLVSVYIQIVGAHLYGQLTRDEPPPAVL